MNLAILFFVAVVLSLQKIPIRIKGQLRMTSTVILTVVWFQQEREEKRKRLCGSPRGSNRVRQREREKVSEREGVRGKGKEKEVNVGREGEISF